MEALAFINLLDRPNPLENQSLHVQLDELCNEAVETGEIPAFFRETVAYIRSRDINNVPLVSDLMQGGIIDLIKRRLGTAIKKSVNCCALPVTVIASYNFDTCQHSILIRCSSCGEYCDIKENAEHAHK